MKKNLALVNRYVCVCVSVITMAAMDSARTRVFESDDLFYELIRPVLPDAAAVEARNGTDDPVQRPELRMRAVMAFRLRRLDRRSKRLVDEHCDAFVAHVRRACLRFRAATERYAGSEATDEDRLAHFQTNYAHVVRTSVWPTLLFNASALQFQHSLEHLFRTRIPGSFKDVYHLLAGDCAVCGWYCRMQLDSVPVWHQRNAAVGEYLPFTSHDHFVEVCFFESVETPYGAMRPAMQLRVDTNFTEADLDFLDFLHVIRATPEHDACIRRLFAERPTHMRNRRRNQFILHLPLFRLKLGSAWAPDSSIAEIFGKTDDEMRALIMRGSRAQRRPRRVVALREGRYGPQQHVML